jgi:hypothetical protein
VEPVAAVVAAGSTNLAAVVVEDTAGEHRVPTTTADHLLAVGRDTIGADTARGRGARQGGDTMMLGRQGEMGWVGMMDGETTTGLGDTTTIDEVSVRPS